MPFHRNVFGLFVLVTFVAGSLRAEKVEDTYPDGTKRSVYHIDDEGRRHGPAEVYRPDGKPKLKAVYKEGKLSGPLKRYHANGKLHENANFKAGLLHGAYAEHDEDAKLVFSAGYKEGGLHGRLREFEEGKLIRDEFWIDDALVLPRMPEEINLTMRKIRAATVKTVGEFPETANYLKAVLDSADQHRKRENALRVLMAYRYLCYLPYEHVQLDRTQIAHCEAGCDILNRVGKMTHHPENPGMPKEQFDFAYKGTSNSNLRMFMSSSASGPPSMTESVKAWMDDSDDSNIDRLGHRRWCINPRMGTTGFGAAGSYSTMWSTDSSHTEVPDYEYIAFPPRGLMPTSAFEDHYAWSISLNPAKYEKPDAEKVKVQVFPAKLNLRNVGLEKGPAMTFDYKNVDLGGFGVSNCIIFRPVGVTVAPGSCYWVEISGLVDKQGEEATISYLVVFIQMQ